jgi:VIT1/CCC1 family predicted Fe2+/Mn2+ transporter
MSHHDSNYEEHHLVHRIGWLRASVMGANDGIVSVSSLIVGVAAANVDKADIIIAGTAALVAGAMSMAAGEYVSVSSQADTERADLAREREALDAEPELEREELAQIYIGRGLDEDLAREVARQLMEHDDLGAHAQDELGISSTVTSQPVQAAWTSAASFSVGAGLPLAAAALAPVSATIPVVAVASLACLAALGATSARAGGANMYTASVRVTFLGVLAMAATAAIGHLVGAAV